MKARVRMKRPGLVARLQLHPRGIKPGGQWALGPRSRLRQAILGLLHERVTMSPIRAAVPGPTNPNLSPCRHLRL